MPFSASRTLAAVLATAGLALAGLGVAAPAAAVPSVPIVFNEVATNDSTDWFELYNTSGTDVDLSGYIVDHTNDTSEKVTLPPGSLVPAHGVLEASFPDGFKKADTAELKTPDATVVVDSYTWTAHGDPSWARTVDGAGTWILASTATPGVLNSSLWQSIKLNEVATNDSPDWFELYNTSAGPIDVGGFVLDHTAVAGEATTVPAGSVVPAHGVLAVDFAAGFKKADTAKLYGADGTTLLDSFTWTAHGDPSYARTPDGTGSWALTGAATKGAPNDGATTPPPSGPDCDTEAPTGSGPAIAGGVVWPGSSAWTQADQVCEFVTPRSGQDVSGLAFDPSDSNVLWAAKNKSHIFKLVKSGGLWLPASGDWASGKEIAFPGGSGQPDTEGITVGPDGFLYLTTERDNASSSTSLDTVLRFDPNASGATIQPTTEWDLTSDFVPSVLAATGDDANLGFEGITWVPDSYLTSHGFIDQSTNEPYDPTDYEQHGTGLYFLALEKNGHLYAYALGSDGSHHRIADVATGMPAIADTQWDATTQQLWAVADNTSSGTTELLTIHGGDFGVDAVYDRPAGLPNYNLEGFAVAPGSACVNGEREVVRSDDGNNDGHSLWTGTLDCPELAPAVSSAAPGGTVTVTVSGLAPSTDYTLILHSDPVVLGHGLSSTAGALSLAVTIPASTPAGAHTLQLVATADPTIVLAAAPFTVVSALASTGVAPQPLLAAGLALLLGGALLVGLRRRRRAS